MHIGQGAISLSGVSVRFPVYDLADRSLKQQFLGLASKRFFVSESSVFSVNALQDLTLNIEQGERVALIGLNGAGKTTLLQVIAGIYKPTKGRCDKSGRVASMMNMTYGMNSENTGYENINLRATFLGWRGSFLKDRIDEIAEFSGLGPFLKMPIRTYSAGMRLRLAFAIATAVTPDILLMDEWIGFGDQTFVARAEERMMKMVARTGVLVLASHNETMLERVCSRGIVLDGGRIIFDGDIHAALQAYQAVNMDLQGEHRA